MMKIEGYWWGIILSFSGRILHMAGLGQVTFEGWCYIIYSRENCLISKIDLQEYHFH